MLNVAKLTSVADYLVIASGDSERQVRAIAEHVDQMLSVRRHPPLSVEGRTTSQWILMDFGDVVLHVFKADVREHYGLERLWSDARRVPVAPEDDLLAALPASAEPEPPARRARKHR